jgi:putative ABC transport system ATP-binding protein
MNTIIETKNLKKIYRNNGVEVKALRGLNMSVYEAEFLAIMGPSGCGKSTLLYLLGRLDRPTEGEVIVSEQQIHLLNESQRAVLRRNIIGFVFQAYNLIPNLTTAGNIELPALLAGRSPMEARDRQRQLLQALGLEEKETLFPAELSGGEQQRVAIARALVNQPKVLLLDEPTGNLDTRSGARVMEILRNFHAQGQTIVLVTHDPKVASNAKRVAFMRDGTIEDETLLTVPGNTEPILSHIVQLEL